MIAINGTNISQLCIKQISFLVKQTVLKVR